MAGVDFMLVDHVAVRSDASNAVRRDRHPLLPDRGEGAGHVDQPHVRGAEHHRRLGVDRRGDAEAPRHIGDGAEADFLAKLRRDRVDRVGERSADRDLARIAARIVARAPAVDRHRLVDDDIVDLVPGLQRSEINEQLERRARLTNRLRRAVVDRGDIILAADHCADTAVAIEADQRTLRIARRVLPDRLVGGALHAKVERRPYLQRRLGFVDQRLELGQRPIGEIAHAVLARLGRELDRARIGSGGGRLADLAGLGHHVEDDAGTAHRRFGIGGRRIMRRRLDEACDHRGLGKAQIARRMAEEFAASGVDAVRAAAEIDLVEIELEDLVLREFALDGQREHRLAHFSAEIIFVRQEDRPRDLLGDRRRTLQATPGAAIGDARADRAGEAERIDAPMALEAAILDCDDRVLHHLRDLVVFDPLAIARSQRDEDGAVGGMDADHLAVRRGFELVVAGQRGASRIDRDQQRHDGDQPDGDAGDQGPQGDPLPGRAGAPPGFAGGSLRFSGSHRDRWLRPKAAAHKNQPPEASLAPFVLPPRERKSRLTEFMQ